MTRPFTGELIIFSIRGKKNDRVSYRVMSCHRPHNTHEGRVIACHRIRH